MRPSLFVTSNALMALLWASTAEALSFETACENAKLSAAARYHQCLTRAYKRANPHGDEPSEEAIARCDERFDRGFERAEASGACRTPGGSSTLREPLKAGVQQLVDNLMAGTGCADLSIVPGDVATCSVNKTISAIDLAALVDQLSDFGVTDDTTFWIQAWGGNGSNGNVCCNFGGRGGTGGYAQVTTSLNALRSWYRTTELYYYLGLNGTFGGSAGGDGGTSTLVTINDLTQGGVRLVRTLLIAGGGGGGGAGRGARVCAGQFRIIGSGGGAGGVVFSGSSPSSVVVRGQDGEVFVGQITVDNSGKGGTGGGGGAGNGGGSEPGGDPTAPLGGRGGNHDTLQIGFANASGTEVTGGGRGSDGGNQAGGGGGGGGYTGGGGGNRGVSSTECVSGGGGGGSSYVEPIPNSPRCSAAPTTRPANPNSVEGFVQITFDLGACE